MDQSTPWILPDDLAELLRDDPETMHSILETFVEQTNLNLDALETVAATGSLEEVKRAVHKLKGALAQMGAMEASADCLTFERSVAGENREQWLARVSAIRVKCATVMTLVAAVLGKIS